MSSASSRGLFWPASWTGSFGDCFGVLAPLGEPCAAGGAGEAEEALGWVGALARPSELVRATPGVIIGGRETEVILERC